MTDKMLLADRRTILLWPLAAAMLGAVAPLRALAAETTPFSRDTVTTLARALAARRFQPPPSVPEGLRKLSEDRYLEIRYRRNRAIWGGTPTRFTVEPLAPGFLFRDLIDVDVVENGRARPLTADRASFDAPSDQIAALLAEAGRFAGFRLLYPPGGAGRSEEFLEFQGASYFRGVSRGQIYGLSARGLAVDVAEPGGEEFPLFRHFWIERPAARSDNIVVHALLDSRRVTGAFRFGIYPGRTLTMDVDVTLFPRADLAHVALAPLTSMFLFGPADRGGVEDYRPAVHDSHGLAMINGRGERIWRPLTNPATLQISQFMDENPAGFGLVQRDRAFRRFQDLGAQYERRPCAWVQPRGQWGPGHVQLVEIPSRSEANDNIIAYWQPRGGLKAGRAFPYAYRLTWPNDAPERDGLARVVYSAMSRARERETTARQLVIDYAGGALKPDAGIEIEASATRGRVTRTASRGNRMTGGVRVYVTFVPEGANTVELRIRPKLNGEAAGETWLYRWTAE